MIVVSLLVTPLLWQIAASNHHTKAALAEGWTPVILAMTISRYGTYRTTLMSLTLIFGSFGGCILNFAVVRFKGIAVYQPLINGVGGNLAAIQASRMSTFLHMSSEKSSAHKSISARSFNPFAFLFRPGIVVPLLPCIELPNL